MIKKILLGLSGVALLGSLLTFGAFNYKASNTQDFEHSDFKIVEVVKNEKYQQLSYFFSGSFPIDLTKLDMNNKEDVDFVNNIPALQQTNDINTTFSEELDESKGVLFNDAQNQQLGYYDQSLDGTGKFYAVFYDKSVEYDLYLIKDSEQSLVENNNIDSTLLDYYFYEIDGRFYPYLDIIGLQDDEQYIIRFEEYDEDSKIDANNSWNFVPAYSGNTYSQNEDKTYSLKNGIKTTDYTTYDKLSDKPILKINSSDKTEPDTVPSDKPENNTEGTTETVPSKTPVESTESSTEGNTGTTPSKNPTDNTEGNTEGSTETAPIETTKIRGSILAYEYINAGDSNFAFNSIFSQKYANPTVRVINYDDLTAADIEDADLIYFNTNSEDTFYSKEYEKYNKSTDSLSKIDVFTSDIDKKIIDKLYDNKLIVLWGSEFKTNALQHEKMSKTDLVYVLTSNTYASIVKNGKLNSDKTLYDYLDSYDGSLKELYSDVPTFTSAEDTASADTLQRFNIVNTDLAYDICLHGILDLPSDDLISDWDSLLIEKNTLNEKVVGDASSISIESGVSYLLNEDRASGLGSNARLLEIEPCDDYTDKNYWNWRMFGIAPYFTGDVTVEQMNIDEFVCKNTDLLSSYDVIFIGSNYNITKQGGMPYSQWIVDDTVKKYSTVTDYFKLGTLDTDSEIPLSELYKGEDITIKSIIVRASNHTHKAWQGNCDSKELNEITVNFTDDKFIVNAKVLGNYNIKIETNEGINFSFNYIIPLDSYIGTPFNGNMSGKEYWLSSQKLNSTGDLEYINNSKYFTSRDIYSTYRNPYSSTKYYYKLELNKYQVSNYYVDTQPKKWYAQYYDSSMNVLSTVESDDGIFAINTDAPYVRFMFDYSNIDDYYFTYFKYNMDYCYTSDTEITKNTRWGSDNRASKSVRTKDIYLTKGEIYDFKISTYYYPNYSIRHKPSSSFNVDTHNNSSTISIVYNGNSDSVQDYLEIYSSLNLIRLNLNVVNTEFKWSNNEGFPTKFNDSAMNGKIYYHVGDITNGITETSSNYLGAVDDNLTTNDPNRTTRLSGNDLTKKMYDKLVEYINSGRALILSDQLYNEDGTINEVGVDTSSYIYKLMNEYKDKIVNDKDSINFDFSYLDKDSLSLEMVDMPLVYRDYTLFDFDDTKKIAKLNSKKLKNNSNTDSDSDAYNCEDGGKIEYTYDELGITSSDEASTAFYINKDRTKVQQLEMKFKINTSSTYNGTYNAKLYFDKVSDGIFDELERVDFYSLRDEDGYSYNSDNLVAGKTYTLKIKLSDTISGCLHWKLLVTRGDSNNRGSFESYCGILPSEKPRLDILQITPYGAQGKTWSLGDLNNYPAFMKLVKANQDYDIHIMSKTAEDFNTFDFTSFLVNEEGIKKTFAQIDMVIVGFGDWADYIWSDEALQAMGSYIASGKAVIFTHDTSSFVNSDDSKLQINGLDYNSSPKKLKNYYINKFFRNDLGQDKYGVALRYNQPSQSNANFTSVKSLGAQSEEFLNKAKKNGKDLAYTLDTNQSATYYDIDGLTNYINTDKDLAKSDITSASCINRGQITSYPYYIPDNITIKPTHSQYYQLDLEDPNLVVWYTLDNSSANNKAGQDYYYIYNRRNVTYAGVGHEELDKDIPTFEWKLFLNTVLMAYRQSFSASLKCTDDYYSDFEGIVQVYSDYAVDLEYAPWNSTKPTLNNLGNENKVIKFTVFNTNSLPDTTGRLFIKCSGVSWNVTSTQGKIENSCLESRIPNERLLDEYKLPYYNNIYFIKDNVVNPDIFIRADYSQNNPQSSSYEIPVELYRATKGGVQLLDKIIIRDTRRNLYNIR